MTTRDIPLVFDCPRWPACGCPDGTIADDCPGVSRPALIGQPETAAAPPAAADSATGGLSPVASSPAGDTSPPAGVFVTGLPEFLWPGDCALLVDKLELIATFFDTNKMSMSALNTRRAVAIVAAVARSLARVQL